MKIAVAGATGVAGRAVVEVARSRGHEVIQISRSQGVDLLEPQQLQRALVGVDAVIDTSQSPSQDQRVATEFFEAAAANLGHAATGAGVRRTVGLSIIGVDRSPDYGYYVAKVKQEQALRDHAPNPVILRAAQFHDFAGRMLVMSQHAGLAQIIDVPSQPVAVAEVARLLVDLATGAATAPASKVVQLAGPQMERLVDQVRQVVTHRGEDITVIPVEAPVSMAGGSMLPKEGALLRGPTFSEWLADQPTS